MSLLQKLSWECSHTQIPINVPYPVELKQGIQLT